MQIDPILFKLAETDISKIEMINDIDVDYCYQWYYLIKVRELNEMKMKIAEWKRIKER